MKCLMTDLEMETLVKDFSNREEVIKIAIEKWTRATNLSKRSFSNLSIIALTPGCSLCKRTFGVKDKDKPCIGCPLKKNKRDIELNCCYEYAQADWALDEGDYHKYLYWSIQLLNKLKNLLPERG